MSTTILPANVYQVTRFHFMKKTIRDIEQKVGRSEHTIAITFLYVVAHKRSEKKKQQN